MAPPRPPEDGQRGEREWLRSTSVAASGTVRGNVGVGQLFEFTLPSLRGAALGHEGAIVHAAIL